jgi:hypothetical protein
MQLRFFEPILDSEISEPDDANHGVVINLARAAEHFVAFDILQRNWSCSVAAEGLRYDLIAEIDGPRRVQVKMSLRPNFRNPGVSKPYHRFGQTHGGQRPNGRRRRGDRLADYIGDIDLFAFVAFDKKCVLYALPHTIQTNSLKIAAADFTPDRSELSWSEALRFWGVE